jgi:hypothetical protein
MRSRNRLFTNPPPDFVGYRQLPEQTLWCEWYGRERNLSSILSATSEYGTCIDWFFCQEIFSPQSLERIVENAIPQSACKDNQPTFESKTGSEHYCDSSRIIILYNIDNKFRVPNWSLLSNYYLYVYVYCVCLCARARACVRVYMCVRACVCARVVNMYHSNLQGSTPSKYFCNC